MRVAVVGATGAVGHADAARCSSAAAFPADEIVPFASERSAGRQLGDIVVQPLADDTIQGFDVALFSAGGATSREWAPRFAAAGAIVVDNSSAWRMDPDVPLVVSEVNPDALDHIGKGIVANPNCTTMAVMLPAKALHDAFGLTAMVVHLLPGRRRRGPEGHGRARGPGRHRSRPRPRQRRRRRRRVRRVQRARQGAGLQRRAVAGLGGRGRLHRRGDEAPERVAQDPRHPRAARSRRRACACR